MDIGFRQAPLGVHRKLKRVMSSRQGRLEVAQHDIERSEGLDFGSGFSAQRQYTFCVQPSRSSTSKPNSSSETMQLAGATASFAQGVRAANAKPVAGSK